MQKHPFSGVVMDIAAFKVSHSVGTDIDATTLRAHARARSSSTHRGDGTLHMGSIHEKAHILPDTHIATISISAGRWMKVQGKFKMQAHRSSGVVVDIAAFKVSHSGDKDATALRAARARSSSI